MFQRTCFRESICKQKLFILLSYFGQNVQTSQLVNNIILSLARCMDHSFHYKRPGHNCMKLKILLSKCFFFLLKHNKRVGHHLQQCKLSEILADNQVQDLSVLTLSRFVYLHALFWGGLAKQISFE